MKITKKIKSRGWNSSYSTVINWLDQIQGKKMLYSYYLIMESRAGFGCLHTGLGWHFNWAAHPSWTPTPLSIGVRAPCVLSFMWRASIRWWEASFAQNPAGNSLHPKKRCRGSWNQCSMSSMWLRSRRGCCIPGWYKVISFRRAIELDGVNQERNGLLHELGPTGANIEPGAELWRGQENS